MKIHMTKSALESAVQVATIAVAGGSDDAALTSHYVFRITETSVEVLASNGKRTLASAVVAGATVDGVPATFTVSGWRFRNWLQVVPDGDLTLNVEGATIKASFGRNSTKFSSLDPAAFPFWDGNLAKAVLVAKTPATRLFQALSYAKRSASDDESRTPQMVAAVMRAGQLWATDKAILSVVKLPGLEKSEFRIHRNDIPSALAFLGSKNFGDVEILEHERCLFLRRSDGAVVGISRWPHEFPPNVKLPPVDVGMASFDVKIEDLQFALKLLNVSAKKDDTTITFTFKGDDRLFLSVAGFAGDSEEVPLDLAAFTNTDALVQSKHSSFTIGREYLEGAIATHGVETLSTHLTWNDKGGVCFFRADKGGDNFTTLVKWVSR
jgi:hypothetical protein